MLTVFFVVILPHPLRYSSTINNMVQVFAQECLKGSLQHMYGPLYYAAFLLYLNLRLLNTINQIPNQYTRSKTTVFRYPQTFFN